MLERRSMFGLLICLIVCLSIWRISVLETSMMVSDLSYTNQLRQLQNYHLQQHQTNRYAKRIEIDDNNIDIQQTEMMPMKMNDDFRKLIDFDHFEFLINQPGCQMNSSNSNRTKDFREYETNESLVIILVHSAPKNYQKRQLIRETWGAHDSIINVRLIFLLGAVSDPLTEQNRINHENAMYSDIIQGNFIDAYRNMTYKHVMAFKWIVYYCPNVRYLLKTDDDVFVNTPQVIRYLNNNAKRNDLLFCDKHMWSSVKRSYRSKWRVSPREYSGRFYPPYCPGYCIIYSNDVVLRLYRQAQQTPYFWIDDVHVTGTLAQYANINITTASSYILSQTSYNDLFKHQTRNASSFSFLFTWPDIQENQVKKLWKLIEMESFR